MRILVDIDSTITDFGLTLLDELNFISSYTDEIFHTYNEITTYDWFDQNYTNPWKLTETTEFWDKVAINPEAVVTIESWVRQGHTVRLVTASHFTDTLGYKIRKTLESFNPELINERNVIVAQDKNLIKGDVLIDDCIDNLNYNIFPICFAQPWNTEWEGLRTNNWSEIREEISNLAKTKQRLNRAYVFGYKK